MESTVIFFSSTLSFLLAKILVLASYLPFFVIFLLFYFKVLRQLVIATASKFFKRLIIFEQKISIPVNEILLVLDDLFLNFFFF